MRDTSFRFRGGEPLGRGRLIYIDKSTGRQVASPADVSTKVSRLAHGDLRLAISREILPAPNSFDLPYAFGTFHRCSQHTPRTRRMYTVLARGRHREYVVFRTTTVLLYYYGGP